MAWIIAMTVSRHFEELDGDTLQDKIHLIQGIVAKATSPIDLRERLEDSLQNTTRASMCKSTIKRVLPFSPVRHSGFQIGWSGRRPAFRCRRSQRGATGSRKIGH
jgi:hypothetical protein